MHIHDDVRPWGSFRRFTENEPSTVKLIDVLPGQSISLQRHTHRDEFWVILSGNPVLTIGDVTGAAAPGAEHFIPRGTLHRIAAPSGVVVQILEIAFGYFDEHDIERLNDVYGRS